MHAVHDLRCDFARNSVQLVGLCCWLDGRQILNPFKYLSVAILQGTLHLAALCGSLDGRQIFKRFKYASAWWGIYVACPPTEKKAERTCGSIRQLRGEGTVVLNAEEIL